MYFGSHIPTGASFAIKSIEVTEDDLKTIENEINVLKKCKHENIVRYYGTCRKDQSIWVKTGSNLINAIDLDGLLSISLHS